MHENKSQKFKRVNTQTMVVGLDIGKGSIYGYFRAPDGKELKSFEFSNSRQGVEKFWVKLCDFKQVHRLSEVVVGFESSGPYAEPIVHFLKQRPVKLVQINPLHSKRLKELTDNSPNKTDRKDPRVIADVIALGHALTVVVPEGAAAHLRRLTQARERAIKDRTAMLNQLQDLLFVVFPEFSKVIKKISGKAALYLAANYPTPQRIVALGVEELNRIMKRISRGKLNRLAIPLYQAAEGSIGVVEGCQSIEEEVGHLIEKIHCENAFIQRLEEQLGAHLQQIPYSACLLSMRGVGLLTVAGLIGEVGDFRNFSTLSEITKLAGLDLFEVSSGKHKGRRRISKRGRALMRKLLFFAAINTVKTKGIMHAPYARMVESGMPKIKALVAISRKLLAVMFALARDGSNYIEGYSNHRYQQAA
jgi:transposase